MTGLNIALIVALTMTASASVILAVAVVVLVIAVAVDAEEKPGYMYLISNYLSRLFNTIGVGALLKLRRNIMAIQNKFGGWAIVAVSLSIIGCSASGPAFKSVNPIPADKGVVYIYRESSIVGSGVYGAVTANKTPITKIKNGGYFPYIASPGNVHFEVSTEATNEADVSVEAGKEKYLKTSVGMGFLIGRLNFSEVSPEIGKQEIGDCKLLDPVAQ